MRNLTTRKDWLKRNYQRKLADCKTQLGGKCVECASTTDLEFDHIDPATKVKTVTSFINGRNELLQAELLKCQLLCKSCHQNKTNKERVINVFSHGTDNKYDQGCRCTPCKSAHTLRCTEWKLRKKLLMRTQAPVG